MAIYHLSAKIIGRSSGRSSVGAVAYRSGEKIKNEYDRKTHDYTNRKASYRAGENDFMNRKDIVYSEIMLPENAPKEYADRSTLWNAVEIAEKRHDAQTAREIEIALPNELSTEQKIKLVQKFIRENCTSQGMIADFSIHSGHKHTKPNEFNDEPIKPDNPHVHIMLTMRDVSEKGFGNKNRDWNKKPLLMKWRENWANIVNREFERLGIDERIDHRTLEAQGIDREPTIHIGAQGKALEKKGIITERVRKNQEIINRNVEKGLSQYNEKRHEVQRLENRMKEMREHAAQVRDEYGREHFKRIYGVEPEYVKNEYTRNLFDNEVEHIGKFSIQQLQQNRKIDGSIKWYRVNVQEIEKEIADLLFEREKTSIFDFKRRKNIKEQVEKLGEKKARLETAFFNKYNVELKNADILRTEQEELQVSRNYLEVRKIKGALGKLKYG